MEVFTSVEVEFSKVCVSPFVGKPQQRDDPVSLVSLHYKNETTVLKGYYLFWDEK